MWICALTSHVHHWNILKSKSVFLAGIKLVLEGFENFVQQGLPPFLRNVFKISPNKKILECIP